MKKNGICFLVIILPLLLFGAFNNSQNIQAKRKALFCQKMDSLKQLLPIASENDTFDFNLLSIKGWDWYKTNHFLEIDSTFFNTYINHPTPLSGYANYYQTNYFYKIINLDNKLYNLLVLQRIHNDNEAYMYLVQLDEEGNRTDVTTVASLFKSPIDYEVVKSVINHGILIKYRHYHSEDWDGEIEDVKDTVTYNFLKPDKPYPVLNIHISSDNEILVNDTPCSLQQLKDVVKTFMDTSATEIIKIKHLGEYPVSKGVINFSSSRNALYKLYCDVQKEITTAINELRDDLALKKFGKKFEHLDTDFQAAINEAIPLKFEEQHPK